MEKGIIFGTFDVWHTGYALMIEEARRYCDYIVVGLQQENSSKKLVHSLSERFLVLKSLYSIDEIAVYNTDEDLCNLLRFYKPRYRFLGDDYRDDINKIVGYDLSGKIIYIDREHGYSTTEYKERISK
tara:strand:- start:612 stop:995 length:384 start_codon:yes stop_codon:yes gene_type:complete